MNIKELLKEHDHYKSDIFPEIMKLVKMWLRLKNEYLPDDCFEIKHHDGMVFVGIVDEADELNQYGEYPFYHFVKWGIPISELVKDELEEKVKVHERTGYLKWQQEQLAKMKAAAEKAQSDYEHYKKKVESQ